MNNQSRDIIAALALGLLGDLRATGKTQAQITSDLLREHERDGIAIRHVCSLCASLTGVSPVDILADVLAAADNEMGEGME